MVLAQKEKNFRSSRLGEIGINLKTIYLGDLPQNEEGLLFLSGSYAEQDAKSIKNMIFKFEGAPSLRLRLTGKRI